MTISIDEKNAWLILNDLQEIGPITFDKLMRVFNNDPVEILNASRQALIRVDGVGEVIADMIVNWEKHFDLKKELKRCDGFGVDFVSRADSAYPELLRQVYDPPIGLYMRGRYRSTTKTIAIVGSRRCTLYGIAMAQKIAGDLARMGFCIVSGMARGIDSAAHSAAIDAGGKTIAVMGCGIDIVYPPENKDLYDNIIEHGAVVSEFPFGRRADKQTFPMRNRIVSGMVQAVVVIESDSNGGSMITARMAAEQGRQVFAVPGRVDQGASMGCHELIRDGATLCRSADDILEDLQYLGQLEMNLSQEKPMPDNLTDVEALLLKTLRESKALSMDAISNCTQLSITDVSTTLMMLELKKHVVKRADGAFEA